MAKRIKIESSGLDGLDEVVVEQEKPMRTSAAKLCTFCKHSYLRPCTEKTHKLCPNWQHRQRNR